MKNSFKPSIIISLLVLMSSAMGNDVVLATSASNDDSPCTPTRWTTGRGGIVVRGNLAGAGGIDLGSLNPSGVPLGIALDQANNPMHVTDNGNNAAARAGEYIDPVGSPRITGLNWVISQIAGTSDGKVALLYDSWSGSGPDGTAHVQVVNPDGSQVYDTNIAASLGARATNYSLVNLYPIANGEVIVTVEGTTSGCDINSGNLFRFIRLNASGAIATAWTDVSGATHDYNCYTHMAELSNGNLAFSYQTHGDSYSLRIFQPNGTAVTSETSIQKTGTYPAGGSCSAPTNSTYSGDIAANDNGTFLITHHCYANTTFYGVLYNNDGSQVTVGSAKHFVIGTWNNSPYQSTMALTNNNYMVAYSNNNNVNYQLMQVQPNGTVTNVGSYTPQISGNYPKFRNLGDGGFVALDNRISTSGAYDNYYDNAVVYTNSGSVSQAVTDLDTTYADQCDAGTRNNCLSAATGYLMFYPWGTHPGTPGYARGVLYVNGRTKNLVLHSFSVGAPTVTTQAASAITATTATGNGNITATGGANATNRGVIYYPYSNTDKIIGDGGVTNVSETGSFGTGAFTASLTPLSVNSQYNARAHATNSGGTGYGARVAFWTLANVPAAPTVNNPTATTLDVTVNVNGNPAATEFVIQETGTGTYYVQADGSLGLGQVWQNAATWGTKTVTGLTGGTTYTFQVKARNGGATETAYGATASGVPVGIPTVTTQAASAITATAATGNGNITATGGANATTRGVIYYAYTNSDLIIGDGGVTNVSEAGNFGTGAFTASLTPLSVNTQYNNRAYATNSVGTGYGARVAFWTLANVPSAPTVNSPTATTLDVMVNVNGNPAATEFVIEETGTGRYVQADGSLGVGQVWQVAATWGTKTVTGLTNGTTYTFHVKARNGGSIETAYGATASSDTTFIYSLGNRVWFDTDNDGTLNGADVGVSGVRVELYQDNGGIPGVWDAGDTYIGFTTTDASGYYRFDSLPAGDYVVKLPAVNFAAGNPLNTYWSSGTSTAINGAVSDSIGPDPDNDVDSDDNGVTTFSGNTVNYVSAQAVTLGPGASEPTGDNDPVTNPQAGEAPNNQSNRTVDFGFYRVELSNQIFTDVNANGAYDAGDTALPGATVDLYASDGTTLLATTITGAGGTYLFSGLAAGDYIVKVTPPAGYQSTVDTANPGDTTNPNNNIDNNDNGVGTSTGQVSSNIITLTPGSPGAAANNAISNANGTTTNPTMDFGLIFLASEMNLKQDVTAIADGGSYDFGSHMVSTNTDVVFSIENTGNANLTLTTPITIGGADTDQFSIQAQPTSPVTASDSTSFTVRFTPTSAGAKTATISIANNDSDENPYDLTITGTGTCSSAITVTNDADSGAGSLRQAITDLCAGGTIDFDNDYTILLASELAISKNLTITGIGHNVIVSGNHVTRVFNLTGGTITLNQLTIADGNSGSSDGGGIYFNGATLTLTNSTISGNVGSWPGGGGLELWGGTANVSNCSFLGNSAISGGYGGGIDTFRDTTLNVTNSTFSGNSAASAGGGLSVGGTGNIINSTISGNSSGWSIGGGGINNEAGSVTVKNSIIANNTTGNNCFNHYPGYPFNGSTSLVDDGSCGSGFTNSSSILLGTLGNYGGTTQTLPPLPGSAAINAGDSAICTAAPVSSLDQRGVARPTACDIGSFESQGFTLAKTGGDNQSTLINTAFSNPLALSVTSSFSEPVNGGQVTLTAPSSGASLATTTYALTISAGAVSETVSANGTIGAYAVTASAAGAISVDFSLQNQATPVITWSNPADIVYGTLLGATQLNASADTPGAFTYTPAAGTLLTAGPHTLHVDFVPTDTTNYTNASKDVSITVTQATPVITWSNPADIVYGALLGATQLNATADVPGSFVYTPPAGTKLDAGPHTLHVDFTPTDTTNYSNTSKDVSINVTQAAPVITWSNPADIVYGTLLSATQLNATADVPGSFVYAPAAGTKLDTGPHTLHVDFTPTDTTNYANASKDVSITVTQATPGITWSNPANIAYGTPLSATQLNATADAAGTFTYDPIAGTVLAAGPHTLHVDFVPTDTANYTNASKDVSITVTQAAPVITWSNPANIPYSTVLGATQLNATANVAGTFTYNPIAGTVLDVGPHTLHVDFVPTDTTNYTNASKDVSITITKATPIITWNEPARIFVGTALGATQLNATADVPGTFVYTPGEGTVLTVGPHIVHVDFTPTDTVHYTTAAKDVSINVVTGAFYSLQPCRVFDTRTTSTPLTAHEVRVITMAGICGIPSAARAIAANATVVKSTATGDLNIIAGDLTDPGTSVLSIPIDRARANNAIIQLATDGAGTIKVINGSDGTVHLIMDVNGYFR